MTAFQALYLSRSSRERDIERTHIYAEVWRAFDGAYEAERCERGRRCIEIGPEVVASVVDVLPAERREVLQQVRQDWSFDASETRSGRLQVDRVSQAEH